MLRRIWALTQKELIQVLRDRRTVIAILIGPALELLLFSAGIHTQVKHIPMVVADYSMSAASRSYLDAFVVTEDFDIVAMVSSQADVARAIDSGQANLGVVIPPDFATQIARGGANVLMLVDGSSAFTSQSAFSIAEAISQQYAVNLISQQSNPLTAHIQILYNPDLQDVWFITPAFIAFLLQAMTMNLTSLAVVREREMGTIEAILVTPTRPFELMVAKTIPSLFIAFGSGLMLLVVGVLVLDVPFRGSLLLFLVLSLLNLGCGLGLGLAISSAVQTQNQSQQLSSMVNISGMFLAGVLFPAYTLPLMLRIVSYIFPATYFVPVSRGILIKGVGLQDLWVEALALLVSMVVILFVATRLFRQRLD